MASWHWPLFCWPLGWGAGEADIRCVGWKWRKGHRIRAEGTITRFFNKLAMNLIPNIFGRCLCWLRLETWVQRLCQVIHMFLFFNNKTVLYLNLKRFHRSSVQIVKFKSYVHFDSIYLSMDLSFYLYLYIYFFIFLSIFIYIYTVITRKL